MGSLPPPRQKGGTSYLAPDGNRELTIYIKKWEMSLKRRWGEELPVRESDTKPRRKHRIGGRGKKKTFLYERS